MPLAALSQLEVSNKIFLGVDGLWKADKYRGLGSKSRCSEGLPIQRQGEFCSEQQNAPVSSVRKGGGLFHPVVMQHAHCVATLDSDPLAAPISTETPDTAQPTQSQKVSPHRNSEV